MIDAHMHIDLKKEQPLTALLSDMQNNNVSSGVLILNMPDEINAFKKEEKLYLANKGKLKIACGLDLHRDYRSEIKYFTDLGIADLCLKIHPRLFRISKDDIPTVVNAVSDYNGAIIVDSLYYGEYIEYHNGVEVGVALAREFPNRKIIMAHSGSLDFLKCMIATRYLPNVFYDYSFIQNFFQNTSLRLDMVDFLRRTPNRIMFGSDCPSFSVRQAFAEFEKIIKEAGLTESQRSDVLANNASRVYELH